MRTLCSLLDGRLEIATGDITSFDGEAIVNAANSSLLGGGGVDGAIHRAGGPAILAECESLRQGVFKEGLPPGSAVSTTAGKLGAKRVIHTVGPVWHGGLAGEAHILASSYRECLAIAEREALASIAFPAISTGVYCYPKTEAALVAFGAAKAFADSHTVPARIVFVFFKPEDARIFLAANRIRFSPAE